MKNFIMMPQFLNAACNRPTPEPEPQTVDENPEPESQTVDENPEPQE